VWYEITSSPTSRPPLPSVLLARPTTAERIRGVIFDVQENQVVVYPYSEKAVGGDAKRAKRKIRKYWDKSIQQRADRKVQTSDFIGGRHRQSGRHVPNRLAV
jgi:hypothetical protein